MRNARSPNFQSNTHYNTELSPGRDELNMVYNSENSDEDPNLTIVQTEHMDLVPRETYTAGCAFSPDGFKTLDTFYRTPNQKVLNTHFSPERMLGNTGLKTAG